MPNLYALATSAEQAFSASKVIGESVTSVQGELMGVLAVVVPAIALVTAAIVGVKFGLKWLKKLGSNN